MSDPKPFVVARWIGQEIRGTELRPLRTVIESVLTSHLVGKSAEELAEIAEGLDEDVFVALGVVADQDHEQGIEPTFRLEGEINAAYVRADNVRAAEVLSRLRQIEPEEFEGFCTGVLTAIGATARQVGGTGDGGVDFIATNVPIGPPGLAAFRGSYPIVVGQSKRYAKDNLVSVTELRDFLGGAMVRADELKRRDERYGLYSPVTFAFWTTSEFNQVARDFAKRTGIWCLGGLALAQIACHLDMPVAQSEPSKE